MAARRREICATLAYVLVLGWATASSTTPASSEVARGDYPVRTAPQIEETTRATTDVTRVSYDGARKRIEFSVTDGPNLDRIFDDGTIHFSLDLNGLTPAPSQEVVVEIRSWDVDPPFSLCFDDEPSSFEVDNVYLNGRFLGRLRGENDATLWNTFRVSANVLRPGINNFAVDVDVAVGPACWITMIDQARISFDFAVGIHATQAMGDVSIRQTSLDDPVVPDVVFSTTVQSDGDFVPNLPEPLPIADGIESIERSGLQAFDYEYALAMWPESAAQSWQPRVMVDVSFSGPAGNVTDASHELNGQAESASVLIPGQVGKYGLEVQITPELAGTEIGTTIIDHTFYVTLSDPVNYQEPLIVPRTQSNPYGFGTLGQTPPTEWLDIASQWGEGASTQSELLQALQLNEYLRAVSELNWIYGYNVPLPPCQPPKCDLWKHTVLEMLVPGAEKRADCFVFRDVMGLLASAMGATGLLPTTFALPLPGDTYRRFITTTSPALDNNLSANMLNLQSGVRDRWKFISHAFLVDRAPPNWTRYDPTFNVTGGAALLDQIGQFYCFEENIGVCLALNPLDPSLIFDDEPVGQLNGWSVFRYLPEPVQAGDSVLPKLAPGRGPSISLAGAITDRGIDQDENGRYEFIAISVPVNADADAIVVLDATLRDMSGDALVSGQTSTMMEASIPDVVLHLSNGTNLVDVKFIVAPIVDGHTSGPYEANVALKDFDGGTLLDAVHIANYELSELQGKIASDLVVLESLHNGDPIAGFDSLRATIRFSAAVAQDLYYTAELLVGNEILAQDSGTTSVQMGENEFFVDFSAFEIVRRRVNGPYTIRVRVDDAFQGSDATITTLQYSHLDFQPLAARILGPISDVAVDDDSDGLFDELQVQFGVESEDPLDFRVTTVIRHNGSVLGTKYMDVFSSTTLEPVALRFDGAPIAAAEIAGQLELLVSIADPSGVLYDHQEFLTSTYSSGTFSPRPATIISVNQDLPVDLSGNDYFDAIAVDVNVAMQVEREVRLTGHLNDPGGESISVATAEGVYPAGDQVIRLLFPVGSIRARQLDGPYVLARLRLLATDDAQSHVLRPDYITLPYTYETFQPNMLDTEPCEAFVASFDLRFRCTFQLPAPGSYSLSASLYDSTGQFVSSFNGAGTRTLSTPADFVGLFAGEDIFGHGVDGVFEIRDVTVMLAQDGFFYRKSQPIITDSLSASSFEPAAIAFGTVTVNGTPLSNTRIFLDATTEAWTNSLGQYRLWTADGGEYRISIDASPDLAPWTITIVDGITATGVSVPVTLTDGGQVEVNFATNMSGMDSDGDTVPDAMDNCIHHGNPSQLDTDGDGYGNRCDPDFNNDCSVNFADLSYFKDQIFGSNELADLNGDGVVNFADLQIVKDFFFSTPGPGAQGSCS